MSYQKELAVALRAVKMAASLCSRVQETLITVEAIEKKDKSPVTIADLGSQAVISMELLGALPGDSIVGEEEADILRDDRVVCGKVLNLVRDQIETADETQMIDAIEFGTRETDFTKRYWTVDPIDGTKGFLRGEQYAIALALVESGSVVLGVLGCPNFPVSEDRQGCIFSAVKGQGAFMLPMDTDQKIKINVDKLQDPREAKFCESVEKAHASHEEHARISDFLGIAAEPYRIDSQAKYAAVACGNASIYLRLPRSREYREKIWDHAAGTIVVSEAGGKVTDFSGNDLDFTLGEKLLNNQGILATNGYFHDKALEAIASVVGKV